MKAYFAANGMFYRGIFFEVGKTYSWSNIKFNCYGLHAHKRMIDALLAHSFIQNDRVSELPGNFNILEVEVLGESINDQSYQSLIVTNKAKVIRIVPKEEYEGFAVNSNNQLTYYELPKAWKQEYTYDENGNNVYSKLTFITLKADPFEIWRKFDSNNNMIAYKDNKGKNYEITIE